MWTSQALYRKAGSRGRGEALAVRLHNYGGTDVLNYEDAPRPFPANGEVLIRVHATSVNPFDCAVRAGYMTSYFTYPMPLILGTDVSGVIEEVGVGVTDFKPGDQVYTRAGVYKDGSYAEFVTAPAADVAAKPTSLDHIHAAVLPHVSLTAWHAMFDIAGLKDGQTVLIHGAAGGVGHIAAQLAHWMGARVIGTASNNIDLLDDICVDEVINYTTTPFERVVHDVDVVLDTIGGDTQERSFGVLKPGGWLLSLNQPPSPEMAAKYGVHAQLIATSPPIRKTLNELTTLVDSGQIQPVVSRILPLYEVRQAHQLAEGRHTRGKIAIQVVQ